jgi:hypothetical protein
MDAGGAQGLDEPHRAVLLHQDSHRSCLVRYEQRPAALRYQDSDLQNKRTITCAKVEGMRTVRIA